MVLSLGATPFSVVAQERHRSDYVKNAPLYIKGFNVAEVSKRTPGTELKFDMYGSPGGVASLRIAGAQRNFTLTEASPGEYSGIYTIGSRDRTTADSAVTGKLRVGNQVATAILSDLQLRERRGKGKTGKHQGNTPQNTRFDVQPAADVRRGSELAFTLQSTPGAKVDLQINGAQSKYFLEEGNAGEHSGIYTIRRNDHIMPANTVLATLRASDRVSTYNLRQRLVTATPRPVPPSQKAYCGNCGTVEAVNLVEVKAKRAIWAPRWWPGRSFDR